MIEPAQVIALQIDDARSGAQTDLELVLIERLGQIIVRARFQPLDQILALAF